MDEAMWKINGSEGAGGVSPLFLALDTFGRIGGLQRFNQRVIMGLSRYPNARVHLMRDTSSQVPPEYGNFVKAHGNSRISFILSAMRDSLQATTLLVGHVNLLPVAWAIGKLRPNLSIKLFVHGVEVWGDATYRSIPFYEAFLSKRLDAVASVSQFTAKLMAKRYKLMDSDFVSFPNAVDSPNSPPAQISGSQQVLCVSRMAEHDRGKHVDKVIKAVALLRDSHPNMTLKVVGDGVLRGELESLAAQQHIEDRVVFCGRVTDDQLNECYQSSALFVLPSAKEGFGIVYLEAWRHGLPVICGSEGASKEIVTPNVDGIICDHNDIHALAEAIGKLLSNPERSIEMGKAGREKVKEKYLQAHLETRLLKLVTLP